jgi:hypothetical protein
VKRLLNVEMPIGYEWLIDRGIVGFEAFTALQPWHYLPIDQCFWVDERWPAVSELHLLAFAKRQDDDQLACFIVNTAGKAEKVLLIQGWTGHGFDVIKEFPNLWAWLTHVVQDIADWASIEI